MLFLYNSVVCLQFMWRLTSRVVTATYYQRFIQNCSGIAKPLFALTATPKQNKGQARGIVLPLRNSSLVTGRVNIRSRLNY